LLNTCIKAILRLPTQGLHILATESIAEVMPWALCIVANHGIFQFFAKYVNELTKEDFEAKNLADHMRDYVGILSSSLPVARQLSPDFDVKEPEEVPDEDMIEIEFNDVEYVVGDISGRVYEADAEKGDRFVGFIGVGKFHDMKKPE